MMDCGGAASITTLLHRAESDDEEADGIFCTGQREGSAGQDGLAATGGSGNATPASGSSTAVVLRRPRGRPPGSKNKPKPPVVITRDSDQAMRPVVLELSPGADVLECVAGFARQRCVGVSVLSASGAVANVTLRHPALHTSTLTLHGRFDMLSLAGTFLPIPTPSGANSTAIAAAPLAFSSSSSLSIVASAVKSAFTVSLVGSQGQVIGGTVAGTLVAAGPVVLMLASFASPEFHRLPRLPCEVDEEAKPAIMASEQQLQAGSSSVLLHNTAGGGSDVIPWRLPPEVLHWSERGPAPHIRHHLHHHC
ncbi:hypothetical protein Taro_004776 [Colocasia esculenta]|uniref:PPC domain-containing protein n=1 Tax=Colocasia esculenta TaxID=4460 RepID=A0A843TJ33_COLES|nr:hypothetical protein [Colocasia esculenta]